MGILSENEPPFSAGGRSENDIRKQKHENRHIRVYKVAK